MRLARLAAVALALLPLPLTAALLEVGNARTLPPAVVSARDGDLYVGEAQITATAGVRLGAGLVAGRPPRRRSSARSPAASPRASTSSAGTAAESSGSRRASR